MILSRPIYNSSNAKVAQNSNSLISVIIDDSPSNHFYFNKYFEKLISKIKNIYSNDIQIQIYTLNKGKLIYDDLLLNLNSNNINYETSYFNNDKTVIVKELSKLSESNFYSNITLILFSDFQTDVIKDNRLINLINNSKNINTIFYKNLIDINNLAISNVTLDKSIIIPNEIVSITTTIANNTSNIYKSKKIDLYIDDVNVGTYNIDLDAFETQQLTFKTSFVEFGNHNCYIKIDTDDLLEDNYFYFNTTIKDKHDVFVIYNKKEDYYYLSTVFDVIDKKYHNMNISYLNKDSFIINNTFNIDALFIFGYNNIDPILINKINTYDCNTIIFNDNQNSYNSKINEIFNDDNLLNISTNKLSNSSFLTLNTKTIKNNYLSQLLNSDKYNRDIKFFKYKTIKNSNHTLISYSNNDSYLNRYNINRNNFYLFSASLNLLDTNLPLKGSFIPLIYYLINEEKNVHYNYETLNEYDYNSISISTLNIESDLNTYTADIKDDYKNFFGKPGFYSLYGETKNNSSFISLNLDTDEYTMPLNLQELESIFPDTPILTDYKSFTKYISEMIHGIELWRFFLMFLIILIIVEMYLSNIYAYKRK